MTDPIGNLDGGWTIERDVSCVVCPDCAFTFDAVHTNSAEDDHYSCPLCELTARSATPEEDDG